MFIVFIEMHFSGELVSCCAWQTKYVDFLCSTLIVELVGSQNKYMYKLIKIKLKEKKRCNMFFVYIFDKQKKNNISTFLNVTICQICHLIYTPDVCM